MYLSDKYDYKIVDIGTISDFWDGQFIEIYVTDKHLVKKKLIVGNLYRPPNSRIEYMNNFIDDMNNIFVRLRNYKNVVLTGDFNINLLKFKVNHSINEYLDNIMSNGYLPKITMPTRLTQRRGTLIDNFLVKVTHDYSPTTAGVLLFNISDHLPYFISLDYLNSSKTTEKFINFFESGEKNFENFRNDLRKTEVVEKFRNCMKSDINNNCKKFTDVLSQYVNIHFPCKSLRFNKYKHKKSKWITNAILKSISYRDKLYVKLKSVSESNSQYQTLLTNFRTYNRILQQSIRFAKKLYFHKCFEKYKSDVKKTWNTINDIMNKTKNSNSYPKEFLINDNLISDESTIVNEFNKYFVEIGPSLSQKIRPPAGKSFKDYLNKTNLTKFNFKTINEHEVIKAIDTLRPKTSFGQDRISNKLLKYIKNEIAWPLTQLINQSFNSGIFPDLLKVAKVTPLYKKKENYIFDNYRPVSVLSSLSKVFERIMHNQIYLHFQSMKLFFASEYAFRPNHSTEFAALELIDRILSEMDRKNTPLTIFMDLSKAFDTLDHEILLYKLEYYGFSVKSHQLLESYLKNRKQYVEMKNVQSELMALECGVPQGSILGPLLFIIYLNDLPFITKHFTPVIYADDTTMFATLNNTDHTAFENEINQELVLVSNWLKLNKLSLNIGKTKAMVFHTPRRKPFVPNLFIDNVQIEFVDNFNFLGIILDKNLKFKPHITHLTTKISKTIGILNRLKHFLPIGALLNIYNALVVSHLNYGTMIWGNRSGKLKNLQKKAVRIISNAKYNAHTNPLFRNLNILKVDDICTLHDYKFCFKVMNKMVPEYFINISNSIGTFIHDHETRHAADMRLPAVRHEFARDGIRYRFPFAYNNMPDKFKSKIHTHSLAGFKHYIKMNIIKNYDPICHIQNCPIC